jgi:hypothetical protein
MKKTWEVWNELLEKPALTGVELNVKRVNVFLIDFENGPWLYNISPEASAGRQWSDLRETANAVDAIGAPAVARLVHEIADIVEKADQRQHKLGENSCLQPIPPTGSQNCSS